MEMTRLAFGKACCCHDDPKRPKRRWRISILNRICIAVAMTTLAAPAQQADISRLLAEKGAGLTEQQKKQILQQYRNQGSALSPEKALRDTAAHAAGETVMKAAVGDTSLDLSSYEAMLRGISINPDSLLPHLKIFGHDVFTKTGPAAFALSDKMTAPASYPVGPGDEVIIMLWGRINEEYRAKVDRDGRINIPRVGPVAVAGMPFSAMQKSIVDKAQAIEGVQASVTLGELRSIQVFVVGEVRSPGMYTVSALTNVTNALFAAGGPTRRGSLRNIQLTRNGNVVKTIDFYEFLLAGKNYTSLRLEPGDVIHVPVAATMAAIAGNVRHSALYELKGKTTLADLVELAGGVTAAAWVNRVQVERFAENQYQSVLDIEAESAKKLPDFEIQDGDVVKIFPVVIRDQNAVYLSGNVRRPGKYEYRSGMKAADVLGSFANLLSETFYDYAIVKRQAPPHFRESLIPFNLKNALEHADSPDNIALQPRDMIAVFHRDYFEPDRIVTISGAVNNSSSQRLLENMTIRDLIVQAGGLREDASPRHGELYRRTYDGENVKTEKISFCVQCALQNDPQHNLALEKFDRVIIRTKKGWEEERRVTLKGEVAFPGEYVLLEGETLDQLIDRAGGFTDDAYLPGAVFTRESVRQLERKRIDDYARQLQADIVKLSAEMAAKEKTEEAKALLAQQTALLEQLRLIEPVGRVVIDLSARSSYEKFVLEDGDRLLVPKRMGTVSVMGEVYNPATFTLSERKASVSEYIQMAGGYQRNADTRNVYVIKANGSVLTQKTANIRAYHPAPGDAVVVPQRIRHVSGYKILVDTASAFAQVITLATLIATLVITLNQ